MVELTTPQKVGSEQHSLPTDELYIPEMKPAQPVSIVPSMIP
jgi:hypothetical protein